MTIPALINNTRNKQLETGLKNGYSTLSQALLMYENDNGMPISPGTLGNDELKPILMQYIKSVKDCGLGTDTDKACVPNKGFVQDPDNVQDSYMTFSGKSGIDYGWFDDGQFIINNGMTVLLNNPGSEQNQAVTISVDVNGFNKRPNRLGQDLFMFQINNTGALVPMGVKNTAYNTDEYCSKSASGTMNGAACTYKALSEKDFFKKLPK